MALVQVLSNSAAGPSAVIASTTSPVVEHWRTERVHTRNRIALRRARPRAQRLEFGLKLGQGSMRFSALS